MLGSEKRNLGPRTRRALMCVALAAVIQAGCASPQYLISYPASVAVEQGEPNAKPAPPIEPARAPAGAPSIEQVESNYHKVSVMYGTDRNELPGHDPTLRFGTSRGLSTVRYGIATVSIPFTHQTGELETYHWYKLEFSPNPEDHVMLLGTKPLDHDAWVAEMRTRLSSATQRSQLIYIHGFNVSFTDAARRAAQLSWDLEFKGVPAFFSWASAASTFMYTTDEATVEWSIPHLEEFLISAISSSDAQNVYIIAHSMGARLLSRALERLALDAPEMKGRIKDIVFAAPDIDADVFKEQILPRLANVPVTLYASSKDKAIELSYEIHTYVRAGSGPPHLLISPPMETIDASMFNTDFLTHSYYADEPALLEDLKALFSGKKAAERKPRIVPGDDGGDYFKFAEPLP